jgi:hypothetical protein
VLGEAYQGVGVDRDAGSMRDVVQHHGCIDRVRDGGEVSDQARLRRLVVVRGDHQQAVHTGLLG